MKEIQASDEEIEQFNISQNQLSSNMIIQEDALKLRVENEQLKVQIEIMKNCTNCRYGSDCQQNDNSDCSRCLYGLNHCKNPKNKDNAYRDFEDVCEYWEIIR